MTVKISVAMATYNGAKYIRQQLDTIATQSYLPIELVVCDDGSSDCTIDIVHHFAQAVSFPVRIFINDHNLGFANNFLKCASLCCGEWIAFCDQDDIWLPQKLASIKNIIDQSTDELVLVYHAAELVNEHLEPLGRYLPLIAKDQVTLIASHSGFWFVGGCVMCFKADLIGNIDSDLRPRDNYMFNESWCLEDYPWMPHDKWVCLLANISGEIAAVAQTLSLYRRHGYALTGPHDKSTVTDSIVKMTETGNDAYKFLARISLETASSLSQMSDFITDDRRKENFAEGVKKFERIASFCEMRFKLYSTKDIRVKVATFAWLAFNRAYFGDKFTSFGFISILKDVAHIGGVISCIRILQNKGLLQ